MALVAVENGLEERRGHGFAVTNAADGAADGLHDVTLAATVFLGQIGEREIAAVVVNQDIAIPARKRGGQGLLAAVVAVGVDILHLIEQARAAGLLPDEQVCVALDAEHVKCQAVEPAPILGNAGDVAVVVQILPDLGVGALADATDALDAIDEAEAIETAKLEEWYACVSKDSALFHLSYPLKSQLP